MSTLSKLLISIFTLLLICGCSVPTEQGEVMGETEDFRPPPPERAILSISTQGTINALIDSIVVTVILPPGVVVKASPDPDNSSVLRADKDVVGESGVGIGHVGVTALYTAATASAPGKLMVHARVYSGLNLGEFATVKCDIVKGRSPVPLEFSLMDFRAMDSTGAVITGLSAGFELDII